MSEYETQYQCELCKGTFEKGRTDKESLEESTKIWGKLPEQELAVICDDCFNKIMPNKKSFDAFTKAFASYVTSVLQIKPEDLEKITKASVKYADALLAELEK